MIPVEKFLDRLQNVRAMGQDSWMAACPAHDDKTASLHVTVARDDGRILLHDFGQGCEVGEVCTAVGLRVSDLMPTRRTRPYMRPEERGTNVTRATATDLLELLDHHATVVLHVVCDALDRDRKLLTRDERAALIESAAVIGNVRATIRPAKRPKEKRR